MSLGKIVVVCVAAAFLFTAPALFAAGHGAATGGTTGAATGHGTTTTTDKPAAEPAPPAQELNDKIAAAKKTAAEAATAHTEAATGKAPDSTQPAEEYKNDPSKRKTVDLTDQDRVSRFEDAAKKFEAAAKQVADVKAVLEKHPGVIDSGAVDQVLKSVNTQLAQTLVDEVKFRMAKKLGEPAALEKLTAQALKADPNNSNAQSLDAQLKEMIKAAEHKTDTPKPAATPAAHK